MYRGQNSLFKANRMIILAGLILLMAILTVNLSSATLITHLKFNEDTGTTAVDYMGNYNGTLSTNVNRVTGKGGTAVNISNTASNNVSMGDPTGFEVDTFTIEFWLNSSGVNDNLNIFKFAAAAGELGISTSSWGLYVGDGSWDSVALTSNYFPAGVWTHVAYVKNTTGLSIYLNGVLNNSADSTKTITYGSYEAVLGGAYSSRFIDEFMFWDEARTSAQIQEDMEIFDIILNSPTDDSISINPTITFNSSYITTGYNLTNATLWIWKAGVIFNNTEVKSINGTSNSSLFTISGFNVGSYTWNVLACGINATGSSCSSADANYSFEGKLFNETSQTFNPTTLSGAAEEFSINITYNSTHYIGISTSLVYNNVSYTSNPSGTGNDKTFTRSITIPGVTTQTNFSFYWQFAFTNATGISYSNSSIKSQIANTVVVDDCSTYSVLILNYTMRDERTQSFINGTMHNSSIELDLQLYPIGGTSIAGNLSFSYNVTHNAQVCLNLNLSTTSYNLYTQTRYKADDYVTRYHYLQNYTLSNSSLLQDINLFDLKEDYATKFLITYKDENFAVTSDALININKKYVSEGLYKTVEVGKTDNFGQIVAHLDLTGVSYSFSVLKEGVTLALFNNTAIYCEDVAIGNCKINLYSPVADVQTTDFYTYYNLAYLMSFSQSTRTLTVEFQTLDNSVSNMWINLTQLTNWGNTSICSNSVTAASGTLTCLVPASYGNITFIAELYKDGYLVNRDLYTIVQETVDIYGDNTLVLLMVLFLTLPLLFIPSTIGVMFGVILGLIVSITLAFVSGAIIATAGFFIWGAIAAVIIIWKLNSRGV